MLEKISTIGEGIEDSREKLRINKVILSILLSIFILAIAQVASMLFGSLFVKLGLSIAIGNIISGIAYAVLTLLGLSILCKKVLKISMKDCKITGIKIKPIWIIVAFIMPILVSLLLIAMPGEWSYSNMDTKTINATITGGIIYFGIATGIVEEAVFRGVIMTALERRYNKTVAILVPSMIFGLIHITGRDLDFISVLQLFVAGSMVGILFSLVTYQSGSIWNSAIIHAVWNAIIIGGILNIGVEVDKNSIINYTLKTKSFLISGGDFGIEASIVSVLAYIIFATLAIHLYKKMRAI